MELLPLVFSICFFSSSCSRGSHGGGISTSGIGKKKYLDFYNFRTRQRFCAHTEKSGKSSASETNNIMKCSQWEVTHRITVQLRPSPRNGCVGRSVVTNHRGLS